MPPFPLRWCSVATHDSFCLGCLLGTRWDTLTLLVLTRYMEALSLLWCTGAPCMWFVQTHAVSLIHITQSGGSAFMVLCI